MSGKIKAFLIEVLIGVMALVFVVLIFGIIIVTAFWLHGQFLDIFNGSCYTDMFGDVICKIKK